MTRYELIERIGVGAMAEIYRGKAVAAGGFEKPVAIKRILPHLGQDRRFVEALIAEAKILSQLRHRNIVQIFDVGLGDDGQYFLVMEYVDGLDLGGIQRALEGRRKRLPLDLSLHLGAEVCEALEHAHGALSPAGEPMRLVHRDVAPSNVLVSRHGEVKLTDFGLARRPDEVTGHGGMRGKFGYMAPEAADGQAISARSDVFSVAAVIYEITLGRRLFSHLGDLEALRAVRECNVPRPRDLDPSLPAALDEILMGALVADPARRTRSAGELASQLRGLRYSLDSAAGDPAQELARVVVGVEAADGGPASDAPSDARKAAGRRRRAPPSSGAFGHEPTVLTLTSLDPFGDDRDGTGLIKARAILDRFEEEETRLASVPGMTAWAARDALDTEPPPLGPRETAPTGIFVGGGLPGAARGARDGETGEVTFTGSPRPITDDADESTRVLSPAQLARRAPPTPTRLPGMARGKQGAAAPPPTPPKPAPRGTPAEVVATTPARSATPTVADPPRKADAASPATTSSAAMKAAKPSPAKATPVKVAPPDADASSPSVPRVAGFDASRGNARARAYLIIAAILLAILGAGITAAILR